MLIDLASEQTFPVGELVGVAIAFILLTLLFRSGAAMAVTLVGALIGVMAGQILLTALAAPLDLPAFASVIAMMLGLGAGIDYSLLIIARYREQAAAGNSTRDAAAKAAATSGASVVAAGADRDGRDRRPARDRHPVHRQARPRRRRSPSARWSCPRSRSCRS